MKVNEIFYSLQGEGHFSGTPAIFVRFSGCNLNCDFCDTIHHHGKEMTEEEIVSEVCKYPSVHVVITGGEPTIQLTASLINKLHKARKFVQIETNGTLKLKEELECLIDWITCSPKYGNIPNIQRIDELKVIYDKDNIKHIENLESVEATYRNCYYLQPCDSGDNITNKINLTSCLKYIMEHPKWNLSLQTHKMLGLR